MIRKAFVAASAVALLLTAATAPAQANDPKRPVLSPVTAALAAMMGPDDPAPVEVDIRDPKDLKPGTAYLKRDGKLFELPIKPVETPKGKVSAQAVNGCPQSSDSGGYGHLCLYKWINWAGGRWQASMANFWPASINSTIGSCWNLSGSTYTTGGSVNDSAGSFYVTSSSNAPTGAPANSPGPHVWYWMIFDWVNCQSAGDLIFMPVEYSSSDSTLEWQYQSFYHNPTSVQTVSDTALGNYMH